MTQSIRSSKFVFTWGPGAILEGQNGPRVIPRPDIGIFTPNSDLKPENFQISDRRMSEGLLGGSMIFKLPSNSELGVGENEAIYCTKRFPEWSLCLNRREHQEDFYVLYHEDYCPVCGRYGRRGQEAVRFIVACPRGHMDDVDWWFLVHRKGGTSCPHRNWFRWYGGGGMLSEIEIECPECRIRVNLGEAYNIKWSCSGRFPEQEQLDDSPLCSSCDSNARMIQRQASNLRIPDLRTLFTILWYTELHNLIQKDIIRAALFTNEIPESKDELERILNNLVNERLITLITHDSILGNTWPQIHQAIRDVRSPIPHSYNALILQEFHALIDASINGAPPARLPRYASPVIFEVIRDFVRKFCSPGGTTFSIAPIQRMRTVTVQTGYRREVDTENPAEPVDISFLHNGEIWYPGVEFLGEGIFIRFDEDSGWYDLQKGDSAETWINVYNESSSYPSHVFRDSQEKIELHPEFVWWHTLGHLLIRAISVESGYSSASIRERIYLETDGFKARGGILLYATQPGSEGTLGGLIALVPHFEDIFEMAFEQLAFCSGDPLCIENKFSQGKYNGAACYGCLLLSETSCEHRNMWLDRNIVLENSP
ncbi:MAG: DUF1998 domain-containing protein [Theionarchaea archaeon]|nr:DUF1998 domain-containing protein [Theionarchaea archaeon]